MAYDRNRRVYWVSWRALARSARKAAEPMSSSLAASARCAVCGDDRLQRRQHALAVGLAERDQPHAGGDPIGGDRLQERGERRFERNAMAGGGDRHRHRIGDRAVPDCFQPVERRAWPGRAVAARRRCLARSFPDGAPWRAPRRRRARRPRASALSSACSTARWACANSTASQKPPPSASMTPSQARKRLGVLDVAGLHRPFDAAGIGEGADRIGRRQPGHQAVEGAARSAAPFPASMPARRRESSILASAVLHDGAVPLRSPLARGRADESRGASYYAPWLVPMVLRRCRLRIERRVERREAARRGRAASPPARDRGGCASCRRRSARRCGGCRDARRAAPCRARCRRRSRSALPARRRPARSSRRRAPARRRRADSPAWRNRAGTRCPFRPVKHDAPALAVARLEHDAVARP